MIKSIFGYKARFCNQSCAESFKEDRKSGLIYGPFKINGVFASSAEEASLATCRCAYCGESVKGPIPKKCVEKFKMDEAILKKNGFKICQ